MKANQKISNETLINQKLSSISRKKLIKLKSKNALVLFSANLLTSRKLCVNEVKLTITEKGSYFWSEILDFKF